MHTRPFLFFLLFFCASAALQAQDTSLLKQLNDTMDLHAKGGYTMGTFKATHVINMHTVEGPAKGALNFLIQHRFGQLNSGTYNFFGLDNANLRLGFDYGLTDRLAIGIGRSSYLKTFDGYLKYKLLRQTDENGMPVSVSVLGIISNYTQVHLLYDSVLNAGRRTAYVGQVLIARKFNSNLSLQFVPTYLHYNLVATTQDKNDIFALGIGGRLKITRRMSINAEYNYLPSNQIVSVKVYNSFSLGWDIETGGHVFQLVFSNSQSMTESQYIAQAIPGVAQSTGRWSNGDIYFGFNISRVFNLKKKK